MDDKQQAESPIGTPQAFWRCSSCGALNDITRDACGFCNSSRGSLTYHWQTDSDNEPYREFRAYRNRPLCDANGDVLSLDQLEALVALAQCQIQTIAALRDLNAKMPIHCRHEDKVDVTKMEEYGRWRVWRCPTCGAEIRETTISG